MKKLLLITLLIICICISQVNAWQIVSDKYKGTVALNGDGTGHIQVDGYGETDFTWELVGDYKYEAHYWFYTVPFTYNLENDTITSSSTNAILVR